MGDPPLGIIYTLRSRHYYQQKGSCPILFFLIFYKWGYLVSFSVILNDIFISIMSSLLFFVNSLSVATHPPASATSFLIFSISSRASFS